MSSEDVELEDTMEDEEEEGYPYIAQDAESQLQMKVLKACIAAAVPVGFVSDPGEGKTATIKAVAESTGRTFVPLSLTTMLPEDVSGIPTIVKKQIGEGKSQQEIAVTQYAMMNWQKKVQIHPHSVLFLDEFSTAGSSTQHAFLQICQDRIFPGSDKPFSNKVAIILAMNPADQAGGITLDPPIANRFAWFPFATSYEGYIEGFLNGFRSDTPMHMPDIVTDPAQVKRNDKAFRSLVKDYLDVEGHHQLKELPDDRDDVSNISPNDDDYRARQEIASLAYMTPRSWDNFAKIAKYFEPDDYVAIAKTAEGVIGMKNAEPFISFYKQNADSLSLEKVLADPKKIDWSHQSINSTVPLFRGLIRVSKEGRWTEAIKVYFAIAEAGQLDLLSGNRIHDIWQAEYMKGVPSDEFEKIRKTYLHYFKDMLVTSTQGTAKRSKTKAGGK